MTERRKRNRAAAKPGEPVSDLLPDQPTLPGVREIAAGCKACDLYKRGTQTVFGEGPPKAELMLVGEQPGDAEDLAGHPFVGPAGRLLDTALEEAGIDRRQVYVTNVVKHFKWEPRDRRLPSVARSRDRARQASRAGLPRGHRGPGPARQVFQGVATAWHAGAVTARPDCERNRASLVDPACARR